VRWTDPADTSLSCLACLIPSSTALYDIKYKLLASNEVCADSIEFQVSVDRSRRLFVPNIFTPNGDGVNDHLTISSPDYGLVEEMVIRDRWGSIIHNSGDFEVGGTETMWDGSTGKQFVASGVYTWNARIRFFDGEVEWFAGQVTVLR
jgi:gliding motility-associated-like protein